MAKIICTRRGAMGVHTLPQKNKEGKLDPSTVQFFHIPGSAGMNRGGKPADRRAVEIPDDLWKELKAKDPFVRGAVAKRELVEVDGEPEPAAPEGDPNAPAW